MTDVKTTLTNINSNRPLLVGINLVSLGFTVNRYRKDRSVWNLLRMASSVFFVAEAAFKPKPVE